MLKYRMFIFIILCNKHVINNHIFYVNSFIFKSTARRNEHLILFYYFNACQKCLSKLKVAPDNYLCPICI